MHTLWSKRWRAGSWSLDWGLQCKSKNEWIQSTSQVWHSDKIRKIAKQKPANPTVQMQTNFISIHISRCNCICKTSLNQLFKNRKCWGIWFSVIKATSFHFIHLVALQQSIHSQVMDLHRLGQRYLKTIS